MDKVCSVEGCDLEAVHRGWCHKHYQRWWKHGDPNTVLTGWENYVPSVCSVSGCESLVKARGWCRKHYKRWLAHGDPIKTLITAKGTYTTCTRPDCDKPHFAKGLCKNHHNLASLDDSINYRLSHSLRRRITNAVKNGQKAGSAVKDLGCSIPHFRLYIENQFLSGMTWDNYGEWHLDHVIPLAKYDLTDRSQFLEAANWLNYQPLWASENLAKGAN